MLEYRSAKSRYVLGPQSSEGDIHGGMSQAGPLHEERKCLQCRLAT